MAEIAEIATRARFDLIRYAQVWEDADVLLAALAIAPGQRLLSIASAGDNTLALLTQNPAKVVAFDLSAAQLHCLALRIAAYRLLTHQELLELVGSVPSKRRLQLYGRCRVALSQPTRAFWDDKRQAIARGIGSIGKFERYFALFRRLVLPLLLSQSNREWLFCLAEQGERQVFFERHILTWRWRWLFGLFFSRSLMGYLGRDPSFFEHGQGDLGVHLQARLYHGLVVLNPAENPYLDWIVFGEHRHALPLALRPEHFEQIRANLDRLELRLGGLDQVLVADERFDGFNLSDIFEYMSPAGYQTALEQLLAHAQAEARLVYWNLLAPRQCPAALAERLRPLTEAARVLFEQDKAFFYSRLVLEEVI
jgi:S-adenosylmethionine-diacylglycerol 3-amino-3-carboxypropyl transferase